MTAGGLDLETAQAAYSVAHRTPSRRGNWSDARGIMRLRHMGVRFYVNGPSRHLSVVKLPAFSQVKWGEEDRT